MAKIFISYRHLGGAAMGQLLCDRLKAKRHSVFFDRDSLVAGKYPEKIYEAIENCDCVLLILPENSLNRCVSDPEDWVRREIRHGLKHGKPIIPIFLRGFVFPAELPEDIREIKDYHGISFEKMECFEETVDKLCRMLPLTGLRKGIHSVGGLFIKLRRCVGKILEAFWRWKFVRGVILFFLGFMVLAYGVEIVRYINNANVDQWIRPMTLYKENAYTLNVPISPDNKRMAVYDGNGQIFLSKVEGNTAESDGLGVLETSFAGKPALVGFQGSKYCCAVCEGDMEIFDLDRSAKPTHQLHFGDYDPNYFVQSVQWSNDFTSFVALWAEKDTGKLSHCTFYDGELAHLSTHDLKTCRYLGSADGGQYLLFWDEDTQAVRIIDTQTRTEGDLKTMGTACYEKIDQNSDSYWNFDKNGRYLLCYYPSWNDPYQNRVAVLDLKTGQEVYSGDYRMVGQASFDSENSFVFYNITKEEKLEFRRVRFLEPNDAFEVLLMEEDLARMLEPQSNGEAFYENLYDLYISGIPTICWWPTSNESI